MVIPKLIEKSMPAVSVIRNTNKTQYTLMQYEQLKSEFSNIKYKVTINTTKT